MNNSKFLAKKNSQTKNWNSHRSSRKLKPQGNTNIKKVMYSDCVKNTFRSLPSQSSNDEQKILILLLTHLVV